jgi:hypothetical protein
MLLEKRTTPQETEKLFKWIIGNQGEVKSAFVDNDLGLGYLIYVIGDKSSTRRYLQVEQNEPFSHERVICCGQKLALELEKSGIINFSERQSEK